MCAAERPASSSWSLWLPCSMNLRDRVSARSFFVTSAGQHDPMCEVNLRDRGGDAHVAARSAYDMICGGGGMLHRRGARLLRDCRPGWDTLLRSCGLVSVTSSGVQDGDSSGPIKKSSWHSHGVCE